MYTPHMGFCICCNSSVYILNSAICGFNIIESDTFKKYQLELYSSIGTHCILQCDINEYKFNEFKILANKIIKKILDNLRYDNTKNINIDNIIDEVMNNGKETIKVNYESK